MTQRAGSTPTASRPATLAWGAALACGMVAGCAMVSPAETPAVAASPVDACLSLQERLRAAVAPGESLAELQSRGVRARTPLRFAPGTAPRPGVAPAGAAVRMLIAADGRVVPGSPKVVGSVGDPQIGRALEVAVLSMDFDVDAPARAGAPIPFTATWASCARAEAVSLIPTPLTRHSS